MTLNFPNPSRSFDETKNCVQFWGYDSAIEIIFFVDANALKKLCPDMSSVEAGFLEAFDSARNRIHKAADNAYMSGHNRRDAYSLTAADF